MIFASTTHEVLALNARTGELRWRARTDEAEHARQPGQNVIVAGALVIVPDGAIYAFDRLTGARRWTFRPASGDTPGRFTIATSGGRIFAGSAAGFAYALDADTGAPLWTDTLATDGNTVIAYPVVAGDLVVMSMRRWTNPFTGGVIALDAATGVVRWTRTFVATAPGRGSGSYGRVGIWRDLVIASADDGTVYALHRSDGSIRWTAPRPAGEGGTNDHRPIAVIGDVAVVGSDRPVLVGLDAATGRQRWRLRSTFGTVNYEMGSDDSRLYLVPVQLQLVAIDPAIGTITWTSGSRPIGEYAPYPVSDGAAVYVSGMHGLYALRR